MFLVTLAMCPYCHISELQGRSINTRHPRLIWFLIRAQNSSCFPAYFWFLKRSSMDRWRWLKRHHPPQCLHSGHHKELWLGIWRIETPALLKVKGKTTISQFPGHLRKAKRGEELGHFSCRAGLRPCPHLGGNPAALTLAEVTRHWGTWSSWTRRADIDNHLSSSIETDGTRGFLLPLKSRASWRSRIVVLLNSRGADGPLPPQLAWWAPVKTILHCHCQTWTNYFGTWFRASGVSGHGTNGERHWESLGQSGSTYFIHYSTSRRRHQKGFTRGRFCEDACCDSCTMNLRLVIIRRSAGRLRGCASTSTIPHFDFRLREAFRENCFLTLVATLQLQSPASPSRWPQGSRRLPSRWSALQVKLQC